MYITTPSNHIGVQKNSLGLSEPWCGSSTQISYMWITISNMINIFHFDN